MEFVTRQEAPKELTDNMEEWNRPWIEYYKKSQDHSGSLLKSTKPTAYHWLKDNIRKPLMEDFKNNCGYCGCLIAIPWKLHHQDIAGKGDVDHLRAKSKYPELTYNWFNYIWSCKACNQIKGAFDNENHPIFNPCVAEDCCRLSFIPDVGSYALSLKESNNTALIKRLKNTTDKTLLNSQKICNERRDKVTLLISYFESIHNLLDINENLPESVIEIIRSVNQKEIESNISRIKLTLQSESYKLLILSQYKKLCGVFNNVAELLI